jgi:hypothetical protein
MRRSVAVRLTALALAFCSCAATPALADEYQDTISKAFPGFSILAPSEFHLDTHVDAKVKERPGLVVGRFNPDKLPDFAALIRGSRLIRIPEDKADMVQAMSYYDGYLAVCYGVAAGGYRCEKVTTDPIRITKSFSEYLMKEPPGALTCNLLRKFKAPKAHFDPNVLEPEEGPVEITFSTDAIVINGPGGFVYVNQPGGRYLECLTAD